MDSLKLHLRFYLDLLLKILNKDSYEYIRVKVRDFSESLTGIIRFKVFEEMEIEYPDIEFVIDKKRENGRTYYDKICFNIEVSNKSGLSFDYADGGLTDWSRKILNNKKERMLTSAIGTELLIKTTDIEILKEK